MSEAVSEARATARGALSAALERVHPEMSAAAVERESAWLIHEVRFTLRGRIAWCSLPIGVVLRRRLAEAQNWRCCWCGREMEETGTGPRRATFEHIQPFAKGGSDHPDNLAVACADCNLRRGDAMPEELTHA